MQQLPFNLVDLLVLVITGFAVLRGWRLGLTGFGLRVAGLLLGVAAGLWTAGWLVSSRASPASRLLLESACVLATALIGAALGARLGSAAGQLLAALHLRLPDRLAGAGVRGALGLLVCWLLAAIVAAVGPPAAVDAVAGSQVLSRLSAQLPGPGRVAEDVLHQLAVPADLASLLPASHTGSTPPSRAQVRTAGLRSAGAVVHVEAAGCDAGAMEGSGFVTSGGVVVTNAHVVAGARSITVRGEAGARPAVPVVFDAGGDLAVLDVSGLSEPDLALAAKPADNGSPAVVLGYPGGGPLSAAPAVIIQRLPVLGPRVGGARLSNREVYRLAAAVRPGNSGGPLLDTSGRVIGVVDARSLTDPDVGYALTLTSLRADLAAASAQHREVSTGTCGSAPGAAGRRLGG